MKNVISLIATGLIVSVVNARGKKSKGKCLADPTVSKFDIQKYSGTWFEAYKDENISFGGSECVTANYTYKGDYLGVENTSRREDGSYGGGRGTAYCVDSGMADCQVSFFWFTP